ncbi:DUF4185 domain-containing protein [Phycicoccus sp. M110.8]|uniref:DUF4185 domain-containing protein n=1 Tax=Phycicoccus sp. M110.8 TaxID=3075433 RepID=UPI0028FD1080|nr:DUF4185 domain-containing protein [Phycicoccus sp. M110.8]MDU0315450.1 DUF4185 domain-containing protein [Phycicoccus sp. M110.8]
MRRVVRLAPAALLAAAVALTGCSTGTHAPPGGGAGASGTRAYPRLSPRCPPPAARPPAVTVAQLNRVVAGLDLPLWQAGDIGASARLPDGRLVWVFGDTVRAPDVQPRIVANSMLVTAGLCTSQVEVAGRGPVIPDRSDGVVHWPMSVAVVPRGGEASLVVISARIRRGVGGLDFTYLGSTATVFRLPDGGAPTPVRQLDITPDSPDTTQVNWGSAMTVHDGWIYVYGTRLPSRTAFGRALYVARAPAADARDRGTWRFWDGRAWVADAGRAAVVLPAEGGVSQTLSVDVVGSRFVLVSKRDGDLGSTVYAWDSGAPTGPWEATRGVRADFQDPDGNLAYAPLAHPGIRLTDGRLLISISRNTSDFARLLAQPRLGRPVFAEIDRP